MWEEMEGSISSVGLSISQVPYLSNHSGSKASLPVSWWLMVIENNTRIMVTNLDRAESTVMA